MEKIKLKTVDLIKKFKEREVVKNVSIEVEQGEIVGLLGPNGAGKTTTFYMIIGMIEPNEGKIFFKKKDITSLPMYKRARIGIGYLPQETSIFRKLSVRENILAVLEFQNHKKKRRNEICDKLMEDFTISHLANRMGYMLSGGERRRTEIARTLAISPKFILLDEPFAGIDPIAVEDIMKIISDLKKRDIGVLITDHNVHETLSITDKSYLLVDGVVLKSGSAEMLANDEQVKKLYLGENFKLR